jgi:hypothetical protein
LIITGIIAVVLYVLFKKVQVIENLKRKWKVLICIVALIFYFALQVVWINYRQASPGWDSQCTYQLAVDMYEEKFDNISTSEYATKYPHQLSLAFMESTVFRIFGNSDFKIFQYINAIANIAIIIAIGLIAKELMNKSMFTAIFIGLLFVPIALLVTFVYGDLIGLAFALWSIYFLIKSQKKNKWYLTIISALLLAIGIMFRRNILIFAIAEVLYLLLNLIIKDQDKVKETDCLAENSSEELTLEAKKNRKRIIKDACLKVLIILLFIIISLLPSSLITGLIQNKYNLNKAEQIPTSTYIYIGMTEGTRANGWYNINSLWAWEKPMDEAKQMYSEAISKRVKELFTNPIKLIEFYAKKNISMYAENTYAAIYYNISDNFELDEYKNEEKDKEVTSKQNGLQLYDKALILTVFIGAFVILIKNRKQLSKEELILIIVFAGGFLFHNIWEAKSRYVIPYLIILIPLASKYFTLAEIKRKEKKKRE